MNIHAITVLIIFGNFSNDAKEILTLKTNPPISTLARVGVFDINFPAMELTKLINIYFD